MAEGTYWSGVGGVVKVTPTATGVEITVNNHTWGKDEANRLAEVTNAQSGGATKFISTVDYEDGSFDVVWDSTATPQSVGIQRGKGATLKEYYGNSTKYKSQSIMIEKIATKVNTRGDAIGYTVTYKGNGAITEN